MDENKEFLFKIRKTCLIAKFLTTNWEKIILMRRNTVTIDE